MRTQNEEIAKFDAKLAGLRGELALSDGRQTGDDEIYQHVEGSVADCPKHGQYRRIRAWVEIRGRTLEKFSRCPACIRAEITHAENALQAVTESQLIETARISPRFMHCEFDNFQPVNQQAQENLSVMTAYACAWPHMLANGTSLVLCGKPGTGKNHLAVALAKSIIRSHEANVLITSVMRIIRAFKRAWSRDGEFTEDDLISLYTGCDLLIIDEVGVQYGTNAEQVVLFDIINTRYENMMPTVLISNLTPAQISDAIGDRLTDRMSEGSGAVLVFDWDSYRPMKGAISA